MKDRNLNLDAMRLLGILIIMIAHSSPPGWLFQLRNFGTPLLIVSSALTYSLIFSRKKININKFYKKRLIRLIFPAWLFLGFFFISSYALTKPFGIAYPFSSNEIFSSFLFMDGIGFVWILKIYIILALITPLALYLNHNIKNNSTYFTGLVLAYVTYEILVHVLSLSISGYLETVLNDIVFIAIAYSIVFFYGFRLSTLTNKSLLIVISVTFFIFSFLVYLKYIQTGGFVRTQAFKYPPTIYYLSYAFLATNIVYLIFKSLVISNNTVSKYITWLSSNSLWIYLWHIMGVYLWDYIIGNPKGDFLLFSLKTLFLLTFGIIITLMQKKIVNNFLPKENYYGKRIAELLT